MKFKKTLSIFLMTCLITSFQSMYVLAKNNPAEQKNIQISENVDGRLTKQVGQEYTYEMIDANGTKEIVTVNLDNDTVVSSLHKNKIEKASDYIKDYKETMRAIVLNRANLNPSPMNTVQSKDNISQVIASTSDEWVTGVQNLRYSNEVLVSFTTNALAIIASVLTKGDVTKAREIVNRIVIQLGTSILGSTSTVYYYVSQWYQPNNYMYTREVRDYYHDSTWQNYLSTYTWYFYGSRPY